MKKIDSGLRRYYREIKSWLPCRGAVSRAIMEQMKYNVETYLEQNPNAGTEQLRAYFGAPRDIACSYVEHTDTLEILSALQIRRRIVAVVAGVMAVMLLLWGIFIGYAFVGHKEHIPATYTEELIDPER